jgi:hypothetical protein
MTAEFAGIVDAEQGMISRRIFIEPERPNGQEPEHLLPTATGALQ